MIKNPEYWFYNLDDLKNANPGYFEGEKKDGVVIACDHGRKEPYCKKFRLFHTSKEAAEFAWEFYYGGIGLPSFYEYIGVAHPGQKPYFDVDVPGNAQVNPYEVVDSLVSELSSYCKSNKIKGSIIRVYETSYFNRDDVTGPSPKYSFHVIVEGNSKHLFFEDWNKMAEFGSMIKDMMNPSHGVYIDPIWTKVRQMRMLGSSKKGKFSPKLKFFSLEVDSGIKTEYSDKPLTISDLEESMITTRPTHN